MSETIPNVDYLETLSEKMMDTATESEDIIVKLRMYMIVISELTEAMNGGAGYHYENEFILDDIMETCADEIVKNMKNKQATLAVNEYKEVYDFLTKEVANHLDSYQISKLIEKINS